MKKSLIALAAMAAAGVASAQSSVTLFGIIDTVYTHQSATSAGSVNLLRNDGYNSSRLGFRGTEDLGGGMSASFWLEAGINGDNGTGQASTVNNTGNGGQTTTGVGGFANTNLQARQGLTFNRRSTVSLGGNWGELRVGRDYVPTFWNLTVFDPFGTQGVGSHNNLALGTLNPFGAAAATSAPEVRSSNSIGYFLPANLGGFYGQAMYALSEVPDACNATGAGVGGNVCFGNDNDGRYMGGRIGFASGPFNVAGSWGRTRYGNTAAPVGGGTFFTGDYTAWNLGGQWDFGFGKLLAQYGRQERDATAATATGEQQLRHWLIGGLVPVGAGEIRASYGRATRDDGAAGIDGASQRQWAVGYVHNFSKRTAVYATYARQRVNGPAGTPGASLGSFTAIAPAAGGETNARGFDIGVRHSF